MKPEKVYAVKYKGTWHIATLRLYTDYDTSAHWSDKPPQWTDAESTALLCDWIDAEEVVTLPGEFA